MLVVNIVEKRTWVIKGLPAGIIGPTIYIILYVRAFVKTSRESDLAFLHESEIFLGVFGAPNNRF